MEIKINNGISNAVSNTGVHSTVKVQNALTEIEANNEQFNNVTAALPEYAFEATEDTQIMYGEAVTEPADSVVEIASTRSSITDTYKSYQTRLQDLGFYSGSIDGDLSTAASKKAILNFQRLYGMNETGTMDGNTMGSLSSIYSQYSKAYEATANLPSSYSLDTEQKKNVARVWVFLKNRMGLNSVQAAGAMGNIMRESRFSADNARNTIYPDDHDSNYIFKTDDGIAYGIIMQWCDKTRKEILVSTADKYGLDESDIIAQLACMKAESTNPDICKSGWEDLRECTTVTDSATVFKEHIERYYDNNASLPSRINYAQVFYNVLA